MQNLDEYTGRVEDIDLRLVRGTVVIRDLMFDKLDEDGKDDTIPLVSIARIDATINWHSLLKGKVAGKMLVYRPVIKYTNEVMQDREIKEDTSDFREVIRKLVPISISSFEVQEGQVHFVDPNVKPEIDIFMTNLNITATNLTNVDKNDEVLPAHVTASAGVYNGNYSLDVRLDPLNKQPTFDMKTELKDMDLTPLNPFFKQYGNFEIRKGGFSMVAEFAGKEGKFGGYVKPFVKDFEIEDNHEGEELSQVIWESIVGTSMKILENPKTDNVATKIPVTGEFVDPNVDTWNAIHYVLRNAFVQAIRPTIENSISVNKLNPGHKETFLEKIFGGDDDKKKKKK